MKAKRAQASAPPARTRGVAALRQRLAEAEETLHAIRTGEVDAVVTAGKGGLQIFTLEGAGHVYRLLIESMNEGALTLTTDKMIVYANQCFARMVGCPLEQVMGSSLRRFLSPADRAKLRPLMQQARPAGAKIQVRLHACDGSQMPVQISIRPTTGQGFDRATIGMVVTDLTEARRTEELLRALTRRVVQAQEAERGHVAQELHDNLTQLHCAILFRSQALALKLSAHGSPLQPEAEQLRELAGNAAKEVERISRYLLPGVLDQLGLAAVMHAAGSEFADRTGVSVKLDCVVLPARLPADTELAFYRILQEALKNIEKHSRARHVTVRLTSRDDQVRLAIKDDGVGFNPEPHPTGRNGRGGLGLLGMRERATYVGGVLTVKSVRHAGTEVEVLISLPPANATIDPPSIRSRPASASRRTAARLARPARPH